MVDRLKNFLEHLDPPHCSNCASEMSWSRSTLADAVTIVHVFVCPRCSNLAETKSIARTTGAPPKKLSVPRHRHAA